jgi:biopolymer transport protein ExbD
MIDVVFLLLIFFMCASKFRVLERRLDAHLPRDKGPSSVTQPVKQLDEITLHVTGKGEALRVPEFRVVNWTSNNPNELAAYLKRMKEVGDMPVVIDGRPNCPFRHIMAALDCCARAGLTKVEFRPPPAVDGGGDDSHYRKL